MFRKVLDLIYALAKSMDLSLDSEAIRQAILNGLNALAAVAAATPGIWDDLAVRAATAFVKSAAWDSILAWVLKRVGEEKELPRANADESELAAAFDAIPA